MKLSLERLEIDFTTFKSLEANKVKYLKVVEEHCSKKPELKGKFAELKS